MPQWTEEQRAKERERKRIQRAKYPHYREYARENQRKKREDPEFLEMHRNREKQRRTDDPLYTRRQMLRRQYGMTLEEYESMAQEQGGVCKICCGPPTSRGLVVDHCHKTGKVRGLLCSTCNTALGQFRDDLWTLYRAVSYLERSKVEP